MATTTTTVTNIPQTGTLTFSGTDSINLVIGGASSPAKYAKNCILTNISASNSAFVSFITGATAGSGEYELKAWATLNLDFSNDKPLNIWVNGTNSQKLSRCVL